MAGTETEGMEALRSVRSANSFALAITWAGGQPRARTSRTPVSPSDFDSFCVGVFMING